MSLSSLSKMITSESSDLVPTYLMVQNHFLSSLCLLPEPPFGLILFLDRKKYKYILCHNNERIVQFDQHQYNFFDADPTAGNV